MTTHSPQTRPPSTLHESFAVAAERPELIEVAGFVVRCSVDRASTPPTYRVTTLDACGTIVGESRGVTPDAAILGLSMGDRRELRTALGALLLET